MNLIPITTEFTNCSKTIMAKYLSNKFKSVNNRMDILELGMPIAFLAIASPSWPIVDISSNRQSRKLSGSREKKNIERSVIETKTSQLILDYL